MTDVTPMSMFGPESAKLEVKKLSHYIPVSDELLQWAEEYRRNEEEAIERWNAMTPEEQARATAEWEARRAAEKEARTCKECGCDPDEHGGY